MATPGTVNDPSALLAQLVECVNFAAVKHRTQRRKDHDSTPYINHPIGKVFSLGS